jgi:hypothetical protein
MVSLRAPKPADLLFLVVLALAACSRAPDQEQPKEKPNAPADEARVGAEAGAAPTGQAQDPLPSWSDGPRRRAILDFVTRVTALKGASFVPTAQRIATFDNDGTLWSEKPIYFELAFAFDRVRELAPKHPEWRQKQPFKAVLEKDPKALPPSG